MTRAEQIQQVAGHLTAAGHDLQRALAAAKRISAQDGHDVAQLECGVKLAASGWWTRSKRLNPRISAPGPEGPSEKQTLRRLARKELPASLLRRLHD